ncbi:hypothetical protein XENOCAPTIV_004551 [Xenoophorus captivus]|uniref:Uncharacterized protein n=1 Tax=Xenoophorus captivus TaxID=1517983 RepID=A0ABV0QYG4_9TELE
MYKRIKLGSCRFNDLWNRKNLNKPKNNCNVFILLASQLGLSKEGISLGGASFPVLPPCSEKEVCSSLQRLFFSTPAPQIKTHLDALVDKISKFKHHRYQTARL